MAATVLYRKWRPLLFSDVVGQDAVIQTLQNAVAQERIAHAYLFAGPRGTGKTTTARILAHAINAERGADGAPLMDEAAARAYDEGRAFDLVEIDAASNRGIDDIRELRERANFVPGSAPYKVYLIDEVHQLTGAAGDALLKTLEEPPPHVIFILATTEPEALKPTILSRCQRFDFRRVAVADIVRRLDQIAKVEGITIPEEALQLMGREATGSLRDAVNLLDQVWATYGDAVTLEQAQEALGLSADARALDLARAALTKDLAAGLSTIGAVQADATDLARFKKQVVTHLRHALLLQSKAAESLGLSEPEVEALNGLVQDVAAEVTVDALQAFSAADLRSDPYQPLPLELALAKVVYSPEAIEQAPAPRREGQRRAASGRGGQRELRRRSDSRPRGGEGRRQPAAAGREADPGAAPAQDRRTERRERPPARELSAEEQLLASIRERLKSEGEATLRALLNGSCHVLDLSEDTLRLGFFPFAHEHHLPRVVEKRAVVAKAASEVLGRSVTLECEAIDGDDPSRASPAASRAAAPSPAAGAAPDAAAASDAAPPPDAAATATAEAAPAAETAENAEAAAHSSLVTEAERLGARVVSSEPH